MTGSNLADLKVHLTGCHSADQMADLKGCLTEYLKVGLLSRSRNKKNRVSKV